MSKRSEHLEARRKLRSAARIALESLRAVATDLGQRMPPGHKDWGVIRTRAYIVMLEMLRYRAGLKTIKLAELHAYVTAAREVENWPMQFCAKLSEASHRRAMFRFAGGKMLHLM